LNRTPKTLSKRITYILFLLHLVEKISQEIIKFSVMIRNKSDKKYIVR
jgi:hypothetical protein